MNLRNRELKIRLLYIFIVLGALASCKKAPEIIEVPAPELTERESYEQQLVTDSTFTLDQKLEWLSSSRMALQDSSVITLPYQEQSPNLSSGASYAHLFTAQRGQLLKVELESSDQILVDLFYIQDEMIEQVIVMDDTTQSHYNLDYDGNYLVRVQAELQSNSGFTLRLLAAPQHLMPVAGADNEDAWSRFGDPRDAGRRVHEGVDIFKRRGTPIIASSDGRVTNVSDRGLGGKQVWVRDARLPISHYYAHLDSQYVHENEWVNAGDTLGTVGNTGNALTTRPHLHYGMYLMDVGAIDPFPFIGEPERVRRFRTLQDTIPETWAGPIDHPVRLGPSSRAPILDPSPSQATILGIIGWTNRWWHVRLKDGRAGFVWSE